MRLPELPGGRPRVEEPLARFTAARLGGRAEWLYVARESREELVAAARAAWEQDLPLWVLGGGANVLIADEGLRGLTLINRVGGLFQKGDCVRAAAGLGLMALARACQARGLAGMEWAPGVPGTLGGAVVNNAGAHGSDMAAVLCAALVLDAGGNMRCMEPAELAYGYRQSSLKTGGARRSLVLEATLALRADSPARIQARSAAFSAERRRSQPAGASLGSIFRNPPGDYAGRLIEACGLKGCQIGAAQVSPLHANFFLNRGGATAADYRCLVQLVQAEVQSACGLWLEPEIELLPGGWQ